MDCSDLSDEQNCGNEDVQIAKCHPDEQFQCNDNTCIPGVNILQKIENYSKISKNILKYSTIFHCLKH